MSKCKGCGKEVIFAVDENGKTQVLDKSAPVYVENGVGHMRGPGVQRENRGYVTHFATCSKANDFSASNTNTNQGEKNA